MAFEGVQGVSGSSREVLGREFQRLSGEFYGDFMGEFRDVSKRFKTIRCIEECF